MSVYDELDRIDGKIVSSVATGGVGVISLIGLCSGDAAEVAKRVCEVLRAVLSSSSAGEWPSENEWPKRLPKWFVDACVPAMSQQEAERWLEKWRAMTPEEQAAASEAQGWSLPDWLHWLQPAERQWEFWGCAAESSKSVRLSIRVDAWPFAHGALDWLFHAAGATQVIEEPAT